MTKLKITVISLGIVFGIALPVLTSDEEGFISIFNGKDLTGWEGKEGLWWVEDGAITAESTPEKPCTKHHYLFWRGGQPGNFILRFEYRIQGEGANSGVQFRSEERPDFDAWGYQADIENGKQWTGCLFHHARGGVVMRGYSAIIDYEGKCVERVFADPEKLLEAVKNDDWNTYEISVQGNHIMLSINGQLMCQVWDSDVAYAKRNGWIALQMHPGPPMKIQFRNVRIQEITH